MKKSRAKRIVALYDMLEEREPDISTERLLQMTADGANCLDVGEVVDALVMRGRYKEEKHL